MGKSIKIVYFYTYVAHYVIAILKAIKKIDPTIEITLVYYDKKDARKGPYKIPNLEGINIIPRSSLDKKSLFTLLVTKNPRIIYISGWVDKSYIRAAKKFKQQNKDVSIVTGIDDQWFGTFRQHLGVLFYKIFYSTIFDFFWVAGKPQYHYAQRFGLKSERIITNLLSADTEIFNSKCAVKKRFVFIGRFVEEKGLDILISAYNQLPQSVKTNWPLVLIGSGPLKADIESKHFQNISLLPFLQTEELKSELSMGGVFCMPSKREAWGVAIHELALFGYPLLLSSSCGAATEFLISGYNGYLFQSQNIESLKDKLIKFTQLTDEELELFSQRSLLLGRRITPEISARTLLSTIELM